MIKTRFTFLFFSITTLILCLWVGHAKDWFQGENLFATRDGLSARSESYQHPIAEYVISERITSKSGEEEYQISRSAYGRELIADNPRHGMSAQMKAGGFHLFSTKSEEDADWEVNFNLMGLKTNQGPFLNASNNAVETVCGQKLWFDHGSFIEEYINDDRGLRQNFILLKAPENGTEELEILIDVRTHLQYEMDDDMLSFYKYQDGVRQNLLKYCDLKSWDAAKKELESSMALSGTVLRLIVDIRDAVFPIIIDPLSTTEDWQVESDYANGEIGWSVSSAGDVNGDGYSDLIVGAPWYDYSAGIRPDRGKVLVYHGSSTGLNSTSDWSKDGLMNYDQTGYDVAYAGDVNGDGYGDVLIGSNGYSNGESGEGKVDIYLGSSTGLSTEASWSYEINSASSSLGASVSSAGDINDDGYSDIIVGAPGYTNGQSNEGVALVFLGSSSGVSSSPDWTYEGGAASMALGTSVACAGDVDGDGYSDVVIGAPGYTNSESGEGQVLLFYGSSSGLASSADWTYENNSAGSALGTAVFGAGDVNGDGYGDLIVGAPQYTNAQSNEGIVYLFEGSSSGPGGSPDWSKEPNVASANYGGSVGSAGDINGDGYADIIIGGSGYDNGQTDEGLAEVYLGSGSGLLSSAVWSEESDLANTLYGIAVSSAGDVNGDGYSDIVVGASDYTNGQSNEGAVYVYHGFADIMATSSAWSYESDNSGSGFSTWLGYSVSSAGDVNGDGYDDVLAAAPYFDNGDEDEGKVYVFHGSSSGLSSSPDWSYEGNQSKTYGNGVWMGYSLSCAGDVNGDGYDDIVAGSPNYTNGQDHEGHVFVFKGGSSGLSASPDWTLQVDQAWAGFGRGVAGVGDINGDGYDDIACSAPGYKTVYIYYGSATGPSSTADWSYSHGTYSIGDQVAGAGDINGDGYSDLLFSSISFANGESDEGRAFMFYGSDSGPASTPDWTYEVDQIQAYLGTDIHSLGDVNGDGYSDIGIGVPQYDSDLTNEGAALVFYGSASGLASTPDWTAESDHVESAYSHHRVSSAGDVNGDGYSDLLFSTPNWDDGSQVGEGKVWLYLGGESGLETTPALEMEGNTPSLQFGGDVASAGDVNGDGYSDVIIGAYNYTNGQSGEGAVFVYYGNGGACVRNNVYLMDDGAGSKITADNLNSPTCVLSAFNKPYTGRNNGKLVWECVEEGSPFSSASPITNSTAFTGAQTSYSDLGLTGTTITASAVKVGMRNKVRFRVKLDPVKTFTGQPYLPWKYPQSYLRGAVSMSGAPAVDADLLPVELSLFYAVATDDHKAKLFWVTLTETDNDYFSIERSPDGNIFEQIGQIDGGATTKEQRNYAFTDVRPLVGTNYYRLKQTDFDGTFTYSDIIMVYIDRNSPVNSSDMDFQLYPNPANGDGFSIRMEEGTPEDHPLVISISNTMGQTISTAVYGEEAGNAHSDDISIRMKLEKGLYIVHISNNKRSGSRLLMIE